MAFLHHLFGMNESRNAYNHVYEGRGGYGPDNQSYGYEQPAHHHKSSLTHEIIAGAAGFAGEVSIPFFLFQQNEFSIILHGYSTQYLQTVLSF